MARDDWVGNVEAVNERELGDGGGWAEVGFGWLRGRRGWNGGLGSGVTSAGGIPGGAAAGRGVGFSANWLILLGLMRNWVRFVIF